jgi:hypothetical protein
MEEGVHFTRKDFFSGGKSEEECVEPKSTNCRRYLWWF